MKYQKLVVLQGFEATAALDELTQYGHEDVIEYLAQNEADEGLIMDVPLSYDNVYESDDGYRLTYHMSDNIDTVYIALERIIND